MRCIDVQASYQHAQYASPGLPRRPCRKHLIRLYLATLSALSPFAGERLAFKAPPARNALYAGATHSGRSLRGLLTSLLTAWLTMKSSASGRSSSFTFGRVAPPGRATGHNRPASG